MNSSGFQDYTSIGRRSSEEFRSAFRFTDDVFLSSSKEVSIKVETCTNGMLGLDVCEYFITFLLRRWDALQAKMKEEKD